jgi:signal peptide peptidase SppA
MQLIHIINAVYTKPWLILPSYHATIRQVVRNHLNGLRPSAEALGFFGEDLPDISFVDNIAVIPVKGVITKGASLMEKSCGACSTEDIEAHIETALEANADGIVFDIDSPGGTVTGVPELADLISEVDDDVPTMAFTEGMMASAAYWIGASAGQVYASKSADVGSIGVYVPWIDESEAFERQGVHVEVIRNEGADLKGMGFPGTSLTKEQRQALQDDVNRIADQFHAHIMENRRVTNPTDTFRGQSFIADDAAERGLIDEVLTRKQAFKAFISTL